MIPDSISLDAYLSEKKAAVDNALDEYFTVSKGLSSKIIDAMRYSLFAGGKRLRPILCIAGAEAVGGTQTDILPVACALELIHTYSLIHDDLPVMDDDDLRRGKPSSHKVFGEAVAILAGDGLLTEAFNLIATTKISETVSPDSLLKITGMIARAAGHRGMIGGQLVDIEWEGKTADHALVEFIHTHKTGALITVSVTSGAILGGGDQSQIEAITSYGEKTGLAFQISDDILDIEGERDTMGKVAGADELRGKVTYPAVAGLDRSREIQTELVQDAVKSLEIFGPGAEPLHQIAQYIVERNR